MPETTGRAAEPRAIEPRTATQHTEFTFFWSLRINHVYLWIISKPVLAPLLDITMHVVKAPSISGETTYWRGFLPEHAFLAVAIHCVTFVISLIIGNRFAKMKRRCGTGTTGVFPLGLGGEALQLLVFFPQFLGELPTLIS